MFSVVACKNLFRNTAEIRNKAHKTVHCTLQYHTVLLCVWSLRYDFINVVGDEYMLHRTGDTSGVRASISITTVTLCCTSNRIFLFLTENNT